MINQSIRNNHLILIKNIIWICRHLYAINATPSMSPSAYESHSVDTYLLRRLLIVVQLGQHITNQYEMRMWMRVWVLHTTIICICFILDARLALFNWMIITLFISVPLSVQQDDYYVVLPGLFGHHHICAQSKLPWPYNSSRHPTIPFQSVNAFENEMIN